MRRQLQLRAALRADIDDYRPLLLNRQVGRVLQYAADFSRGFNGPEPLHQVAAELVMADLLGRFYRPEAEDKLLVSISVS